VHKAHTSMLCFLHTVQLCRVQHKITDLMAGARLRMTLLKDRQAL